MKYNPDIHHRRSIRMREYDYSANGAYFVTIRTQARECLFGDISAGEMHLNEAGRMVMDIWKALPERFSDVVLDEYVIMPNHFHGIICITDGYGPNDHDVRRGESCIRPVLIDEHENQGEHKVRPYGTAAGSVGRIVQAFKSMTTTMYINGVKQSGWTPFPGRLWQRNYYERIIRDEKELAAITEYIALNPVRWAEDKENPNS